MVASVVLTLRVRSFPHAEREDYTPGACGDSRLKVSLLVTCLGDALFPDVGVATVQTNTGVPVDTSVTNPFYRCAVGPDCNTMTCAFTGGAAPATFTRLQ